MFKALKLYFSILCIMAFVPALAKEPGQVAIDFLEKVREGKVDLKAGKDTALSPHITEDKRKLIEASIQNLSSQIGVGKLVASTTRQDGDLAAVMVMQAEELDHNKIQVFPVALVKGENGWRAAPMLASFENAVAAYTVPLGARLSELESWMIRQRVIEFENLLVRSTERLRKDIKSRFQENDLTESDPLKIFDRFQKAYAADRQIEVLGYLGGYSESWPSDWDLRMDAIRVAFSPKARGSYPWRLLDSPDVIRVVIDEDLDEDEGLISLACLDPGWDGGGREAEGIQLLHFSFKKDEQGKWILNLPESLMLNDRRVFIDSQGMDEDLLAHFTERLRKVSASKFAKGFEEVEQEVVGQLEHGQMLELLRWVKIDDSSVASRIACVLAAKDWWLFHEPGVYRSPVRLGARVEGDWAVAAYHWFSLNKGERFEIKPMFFHKTPQGWVWVPGSVRNIDPEVGKIFSEWMDREEESWRANAMKKLLESILSLERVRLDHEVKDTEIRELSQKWNQALKQKNIQELFHLSTRLGSDESAALKVFRNLVYELGMAQRLKSELNGIYRVGKWAAAGFTYGEGDEKIFSLILVVPTDKGLKVLSEIDLISDNNRTRKFLNQVSLNRLKSFVSAEELEEIKELFRGFEEEIK